MVRRKDGRPVGSGWSKKAERGSHPEQENDHSYSPVQQQGGKGEVKEDFIEERPGDHHVGLIREEMDEYDIGEKDERAV